MFTHGNNYCGAQRVMAENEYKEVVTLIQHINKYSSEVSPRFIIDLRMGQLVVKYCYDYDDFKHLAMTGTLRIMDKKETINGIVAIDCFQTPQIIERKYEEKNENGEITNIEIVRWVEIEAVKKIRRIESSRGELKMALELQGLRNVIVV